MTSRNARTLMKAMMLLYRLDSFSDNSRKLAGTIGIRLPKVLLKALGKSKFTYSVSSKNRS